ncbi:MAG TPA: hypothetical protein VMD31_08805 [Opitutaceae bacterium]|nr:hypothetical protein [Opitutaceae bacterium]
MNAAASRWSFPAAGVFFFTVLIWLLPPAVSVRSDDFSYLDSVVATIQAGRLRPTEWLAPLNIPLPLISWGVWKLSGSFYLSTVGVGAAIALAGFLLLRAWLRGSLPEGTAVDLVALGVALCPVWLNKSVEFTGVPLELACLLGALLAWRRGWWLLFLLATLVGVANRQSAACLLAFPAVELARGFWRKGHLDRRLLALLVTAVAAVGLIVLLAPPTFGRTWAMAHLRAVFDPVRFAAVWLAGLLLCAALRAGWGLVAGGSVLQPLRRNLQRPWGPVIVLAIGAGLLWTGGFDLLCETPGWTRYSGLLVMAATVLAAGWGDWEHRPEVGVLAFVGLYTGLVAWHLYLWDYYFLAPALVLASSGVRPAAALWRPWLAWGLLGGALAYAGFLHGFLRTDEQKVALYERALRAGTLTIAEASDAPFGYLAWKLFPVARQNGAPDLTDFLKYVQWGRSRCFHGTIVFFREGTRPSVHPSGELWPLPANYQDRRFPLSDHEWSAFLSARAGPP